MRYTIKVTTLILSAGGEVWCDLGTMVWPRCTDEMRVWMAGSCSMTALWMMKQPEAIAGGYTVRYRTLVLDEDEKKVSDSGEVEFTGLSYQTVCDFERWALAELQKMIVLFAAERSAPPLATRPRSVLRTAWSILQQVRRGRGA